MQRESSYYDNKVALKGTDDNGKKEFALTGFTKVGLIQIQVYSEEAGSTFITLSKQELKEVRDLCTELLKTLNYE